MSQQLPSPQLLNQVKDFIKNYGNSNYFCLFLLGSQSGLRVSEAVNFNLSLQKTKNLYLINGKRHKKRSIYVSPAVIKELKKNN
jgi:site-specific recombinase XerD